MLLKHSRYVLASLVVASLPLTLGCQTAHPIKTQVSNNTLHFEIGARADQMSLYSIYVAKQDCVNDCEYWVATGQWDTEHFKGYPMKGGVVKYGESLGAAFTLKQAARELTPGIYIVDGQASANGKASRLFMEEIEIQQSGHTLSVRHISP